MEARLLSGGSIIAVTIHEKGIDHSRLMMMKKKKKEFTSFPATPG